MTRAVVTGASLISPAGFTADENFQAALDGRCAGIDPGFAAPMDRVPLAVLTPNPAIDAAEAKWRERSAALAVLAAAAAVADAGLDARWMHRPNSSIVVGASKAGVLTALAAADALRSGADCDDAKSVGGLWRWGTPACAAEAVAREFRPGGEVASVAAACATGLTALAQGAAMIASGRADTVLVVATDASIHPLFAGSFFRMGALARWRNHPGDACRPFAADRTGFMLSEGAAAVVLRPPHACGKNQKSPRIAIAGSACGNQASNLVRPDDSSEALASILTLARTRAGWSGIDIDLIHAHGTGTPAGDLAETRAIRRALGPAADQTTVISTKPITGHMLGAAGVAQAVLTVMAMQASVIPPTANCTLRDPQCDLDYNRNGRRDSHLARAACLASGFGGGLAAVAFERLR